MMATMNDDSQNGRSLPDGWEWKRLSDICKIIMGQSPPGETYNQTGVGTPLINGPVEFGSTAFSKTIMSKFTTKPAKMCKQGDLILCVRGSTTGRINIAGFDACVGRGVAAIRSHSYQDYINWFIHYQQEEIYKLGTGSTFPNVTSDKIANIKVPFPHVNEQKRIIAKLEELVSDLEAGVAALERVSVGLRRYKVSVLKATLGGKLFASKGAGRNSDELPEGWRRVTLAEITSQIKDADHKMPKHAVSDIPYVSTKDFIGDEDINFENAKHISEEDYKLLTRKIKPELGDILLSRYGTVGQIRKVKTDRPFQASYSIAIIKPLASEVLTDFLVTLLRSEVGQKQMRDNIRASSQPDLGLESIRKFVFPLPPLDEQRRIVAEVERRLSVVGVVESAVEVGLARATRLRQAVLRSAFEGKLL